MALKEIPVPNTQIHNAPPPLVEISGTHREMGRQIGEACREQVQHSIANARILIDQTYNQIELTWEGARHSTQWLVEHYKNPQSFVPGSIMPIFPFSDSQRKALSMYDQSLMPSNPGARPVSTDQDMPNDQLTKAGATTPDLRYMTR